MAAGAVLAATALVAVAPLHAGVPEVEQGLQEGRYGEALAELNTLARAGDPAAQVKLGDLLLHGLAFHDRVVVARNPCAAADWYGQAAAQGNTAAMLRLGYLYVEGQGVRRNLVQAYRLAGVAAKRGERDAAMLRDALTRQMTRRQLEKGERLVGEAQPGS